MNPLLVWSNLVTYSLQLGMVVGLAAFIPTLLRMRLPHVRLLYWQFLLAACLALPVVRPWRQAVFTATMSVARVTTHAAPAVAHPTRLPSPEALLLMAFAAGVLLRLTWLGIGLWRLGRYRRHAHPYRSPLCQAELLISDEVSSPVTFGFLRPVILLPSRFTELSADMQDAILCHETLHVARHDWLFTVGEELVRALLWFHPAIWWLLGEIQLAREQAVDQLVIETTRSRDPYVDALLTMAGARPTLDLAPAPLLLRKRHLKQRVIGILKEVRMSKSRWISALAAGLAIMAAACWFVTGALPLDAEPQMVTDAPGVSVNLNGATLMHRTAVPYPGEARAKGTQGTVTVQVRLNGSGEVSDAAVVSGPDDLRRGVLQSVLTWHFAKDFANTTQTVSVDFALPKDQPVGGLLARTGKISQSPPSAELTAQLKGIEITGLSDQARTELVSQLPVHVGDTVTTDSLMKIIQAVHQYDSHLSVYLARSEGTLQISAPGSATRTGPPPIGGTLAAAVAAPHGAPQESENAANQPKRIRLGGNAAAANLISGPKPEYPPLAKQAKVSGTVELAAVIGKDGTVQDLKVISGHPLLVQASLDAVKDWVYRPTLLNGDPVEVVTTIDVNYTLAQ